ncbi:MAG: glycosyltransferase [Candidatus Korarchaeota archaeon]|nr:glycosyltransferase [Thermoproteota archaeon]
MSKDLTVIITTDAYHPFMSGVTRVIDIFLEELPRYGVRTILIAPYPQRASMRFIQDGHTKKVLLGSFSIKYIYPDINAPRFFDPLIPLRLNIRRILEPSRYVIHAHTPYVATEHIRVSLRPLKWRPPTVLTYHTLVNVYSKVRFGILYGPFMRIERFFLARSLLKSRVVIVPSRYAFEELIEYLPERAKRVAKRTLIIPNPLPRWEYIVPRKTVSELFDFIEDKQYAIWVGRVSHEKNLPYILKIFAGLPYKLVVVGTGPLLNTLKKAAPRNVIFTGFVDDEALKVLLFSARCFIIASPFETFSLAALEAMAHRVPVIAYTEGGYSEFIKHGYNGFRFKNYEEARKYITMIFKDDKLYDELSKNAYETALKYHPDTIIPIHIALYDRLAVEGPPTNY